MEKKFFKASYSIIIMLTLLISCKEKEQIDFNEAIYFANNIKPIRDSINKSNTYKTKLVICTFEKLNGYNKVMLLFPRTPYHIHNNFDYRKIDGMDVLFINYNDTVVNLSKKQIIQPLINNNIITFEGPHENIDYPYYSFVFCRNDNNNITCFDNIMENKLEFKSLAEGKTYNEIMFYPKCR